MKTLQKRQNEENQLELQRKIAQQLRIGYDDVLKDELPPRIEDLLRRLDERLH
jgi:Anti-sigma factor NepR